MNCLGKSCVCLAAVVALASAARAKVEVSSVFSDHAVLQRDRPLPVWGWASPGERVTVSFAKSVATAIAATNGEWCAVLPRQALSRKGRTLVVEGENRIEFSDVLVGDVWLCSGQSNMEMPFSWGIIDGTNEMATASRYPNVRTAKFDHRRSYLPIERASCSPWKVCTPAVLPNVSACAWFFAREINRETGVPIGILDDNWSGSRIEPFIPPETLKATPALKSWHERYTKALDYVRTPKGAKHLSSAVNEMLIWAKYADARRKAGQSIDYWPVYNPLPVTTDTCGQYLSMIYPVRRYPIAGALWYQGCSNGTEGDTYATKLEAMIKGWRTSLGEDFPFYIVQLSSFGEPTDDPAGGNGYALTREAQRAVAGRVAGCGLVVTTDIGNAADVHPKNKLDVALRLSRWALRDVYGRKGLVVSGPIFRTARREGKRLRIKFDHVGSGLVAAEKDPNAPGRAPVRSTDGKLHGFAVAGADRAWHWADAAVDGADVLCWSPEVTEPVAVRYAYRANPMGRGNLYNKEGLPASPFRSDAW